MEQIADTLGFPRCAFTKSDHADKVIEENQLRFLWSSFARWFGRK